MKRLLSTAALIAATLLAPSAFAGPATDTVKSKQTELFKVIAQKKSAGQQAKLRGLFDQMLDYDSLAKGSLGKKWKTLDAAQKKKFHGLLTQLVRNNYRRNLKKMLDYDVVYVKEKRHKKGTRVQTLAKHKSDKREPDIEIDFVVKKRGGKMKVVDLYTERASLVRTYRAQFTRILRKKGFDELIRKMEKKLAKQKG